ncbi:MAG TPA: Hsp20/alpha crystallin family protein [Candidatus Binataceae bacterium]|nr:Hsp20/alpha crystallin family protein [Candidatus Binataceae bacterium]
MSKREAFDLFSSFERELDEFFDSMLINRWRGHERGREFEQAAVYEYRDSYEVKIAMPGIDPARIDVRMIGPRLSITAPRDADQIEFTYLFNTPVDSDAVSASWKADTLTLRAPKRSPRRIKIE